MPPGYHPVNTCKVVVHLLIHQGEVVIIDAGLLGEFRMIRHTLQRLGLGPSSVKAILLTHGHLDHTGNLHALKQWTGAPIYAHRLEVPHIRGEFPYTGVTRWCGRLEAMGRAIIRYRSAEVDHYIEDGEVLPFWGGLQVVHLPGHTLGHCGFYSESRSTFFTGDLFASYFFSTHIPPGILNSHPHQIANSFRRALEIPAQMVFPNHYDFHNGRLHAEKLRRLAGEILKAGTPATFAR